MDHTALIAQARRNYLTSATPLETVLKDVIAKATADSSAKLEEVQVTLNECQEAIKGQRAKIDRLEAEKRETADAMRNAATAHKQALDAKDAKIASLERENKALKSAKKKK